MTKGASGKLLTRTTRLGTHRFMTALYYHDTPVVAWDSNRIILNTGGYLTPSTKMKMNQTARDMHLPFKVFAEAGAWYVVLNWDWENPHLWVDAEFVTFTIQRKGDLLFFSPLEV